MSGISTITTPVIGQLVCLVFRLCGDVHMARGVPLHPEHDWLAAHLAVFNVLLPGLLGVYEHSYSLTAVGAIHRLF